MAGTSIVPGVTVQVASPSTSVTVAVIATSLGLVTVTEPDTTALESVLLGVTLTV
ncbi:MAG: hypothetical protein V9F04_16295 [Dermatophilaceae bacterium]